MKAVDRFTGLPAKLYCRSPFWYWSRFVFSDPFRLALGGRHYGNDFWFRLNIGWYDMQP
jgi:hypothetical protein